MPVLQVKHHMVPVHVTSSLSYGRTFWW